MSRKISNVGRWKPIMTESKYRGWLIGITVIVVVVFILGCILYVVE